MNSQLRTKLPDSELLDRERAEIKRRRSPLQSSTKSASQRVPAPVIANLDHVRSNIRMLAQGLFSTPHQIHSDTARLGSEPPEVPPHVEFAQFSRFYLDSIHKWYPAFHWPTFQHEVNRVYISGSFQGFTREWLGLFFAVLACGSLQAVASIDDSNVVSRGRSFFDIATQALTPWSHNLTTTHAQAALMLSIYATESNMRSIGSMWLASAARIAQELQICPESDSGSIVNDEVRRRLWWAIYVRDR